MTNICYIISGIDKALAFEWIYERLDKNKYKLFFVLLHDTKGGLEEYLVRNNVKYIRINYRGKTDLLKAILDTYKFLKQQQVQIVHCHLLDAGLAGIIAAYFAGIKTRIYTRHYSNYHHVYFPKGLWYDKVINHLSTRIIAVSKVVKRILVDKEKVPANKVSIIHHGFPLSNFNAVVEEDVNKLKQKYSFTEHWPVIGIVSRYTEWKGVQYIIPAFKEILKDYPEAVLILANAKGPYDTEIQKLLSSLPLNSYREIRFEDDLFTLFKSLDLFVHTPVDSESEAFGQVYVEAMAAGKPCVFTLSGIAGEIVQDKINALLVPYRDSPAIRDRIFRILKSDTASASLGQEARKTVQDDFQLKTMILNLEELYA